MKRDSVLSLISIAKKAGRIAAGEFQTESSVKSGKASLVIVSAEASENTKKKFRNMCAFYEVPVYFYGTKDQLGAAIGCEFRASLAVLDEGLSRSIEKKFECKPEADLCSQAGNKAESALSGCGVAPDDVRDGGYEYGENQGS